MTATFRPTRRREGFGDQCRLRAVHHVVRDERQHDGDEHRRRNGGIEHAVTFKWKDYRIEGPERYKVMTLAPHEFIRRFLMHVLPAGFHRIRYYGLLASGQRAENLARARELLMP